LFFIFHYFKGKEKKVKGRKKEKKGRKGNSDKMIDMAGLCNFTRSCIVITISRHCVKQFLLERISTRTTRLTFQQDDHHSNSSTDQQKKKRNEPGSILRNPALLL